MAVKPANGSLQSVIERKRRKQKLRAPKISVMLILTLSGFLCGGVILASTTVVDELARAEAKIMPSGRLRQIENFEGGVIEAVHVQEGQEVAENDVIAVLSSPVLEQEERETTQSLALLDQRIDSLQVIFGLLGQPTELTASIDEDQEGLGPDYALARLSLHMARQNMLKERADNLDQTTVALQAALTIVRDRIIAKEKSIARLANLQERGYVTLSRLDDQVDALDALRGGLVDAELQAATALNEHKQALSTWIENDLTIREELLLELSTLTQERQSTEQRLTSLALRRARLSIRAPSSGTIQSVEFPSPGEVIEPGTTLFELLPSSAVLVAEVKIGTDDIGHVRKGDRVALKLSTYDARRYGQLDGVLTSLSPTFLVDPEGIEYFRATVTLDRTTIGSGIWERPVQAGMIASAEVVTDQRTVLAYLLKPVQRSLEKAFRER